MADVPLRKGVLVRFRLGTRSVQGTIKEDRGPLGIKGRHLYLVEFHPEAHSPGIAEVELPADDLQIVPAVVAGD
jgi:hypothetical protein